MKKESVGIYVSVFIVILLLSVGFVSAFSLSEFWNNLFGNKNLNAPNTGELGTSGVYAEGSSSYCNDTDGGINYYIQGTTANSTDPTRTDSCSNNVLTEQYCGGLSNSSIEAVYYTCPNNCSNGACVSDVTTCFDDCIPGERVRAGDTGYQICGQYDSDSCRDWSPVINCTTGFDNYGICIGSTSNETDLSSCSDSDGGINPSVYGSLTIINRYGVNLIRNDGCGYGANGLGLGEMYCNGTGSGYNIQVFNCSNGCLNGACILGDVATNITQPSQNQTSPSSGSSGGGGGGGGGSSTTPKTNTSNTNNTNVRVAGSQIVTSSSRSSGAITQTALNINSQESTVSSSNGEIVAMSSIQISSAEGKAYATKGDGSKQEIKVDPTTAVSSVKESIKTENIGEIRITEYEDKVVYEIDVVKPVKVIALIPVSMDVKARVDIEEGNIVSVEKPWWSFLATGV